MRKWKGLGTALATVALLFPISQVASGQGGFYTEVMGRKLASPGELTIEVTPHFHFGLHEIRDGDKILHPIAQQMEIDGELAYINYIQTLDLRGTYQGWQLQVRKDGQLQAEDKELIGAEIRIVNVIGANYSDGDPPQVFELVLDPGGALQTSMLARSGTTEGKLQSRKYFGELKEIDGQKFKSGVELFIPASAAIQPTSYTTTVQWFLSEVVDND